MGSQGTFFSSFDISQAAAVTAPMTIATGKELAMPQPSRCGFISEIHVHIRMPT